jgi:hypothetical protein
MQPPIRKDMEARNGDRLRETLMIEKMPDKLEKPIANIKHISRSGRATKNPVRKQARGCL